MIDDFGHSGDGPVALKAFALLARAITRPHRYSDSCFKLAGQHRATIQVQCQKKRACEKTF
jgi:hypothetical protein